VSFFDDLMAIGATAPAPKKAKSKRRTPPSRLARPAPTAPQGPGLFDQLMAFGEPEFEPQPARPQRTPPRRAPRRAPRRSPGRPVAVPGWLEPLLAKAIAAQARKAKPRPSHVLVDLRQQVAHVIARQERGGRVLRQARRAGPLARRLPQAEAWLQAHPAVVLERARRDLPRQPQTPRRAPPSRRKLAGPVNPGIVGIIGTGQSELVDRPIAAECFTGGGLFSIALLVEGVFTPEICEMDENAIETLKLNLHEHAVSSNATTWDPTVPTGGLDLFCGGPPCQSFSQAQSLGTPGMGVSSGENMYPRVLEWIADTQPRVVLMENSAEVATRNSRGVRKSLTVEPPGDTTGEVNDFFSTWWKNLDQLGYEGVFWVLYAPDYGTPQNRTRAWVVAWPKGAPWGEQLRRHPAPTHAHPTSKAVRDGKRLPWISAFDRLLSGCCGGYGLVECINLNNGADACLTCIDGAHFEPAPNQDGEQGRQPQSPKAIDTFAGWASPGRTRLSMIRPIDLSPWSAFRKRDPIGQVKGGAKVIDWLSKAITAHFGKDAKSGAIIPFDIPKGVYDLQDSRSVADRKRFSSWLQRVSVRDAAKLQDVPQWWAFSWNPRVANTTAKQRKAVFRQIGNGIPVNMGRAAVRQVLTALGYPNPIPQTFAADPSSGLWPEDRVDPCGLFNAPYAYPGALHDTIAEAYEPSDFLGAYDAGVEAESDALDEQADAMGAVPMGRRLSRGRRRRFPLRNRYKRMQQRLAAAVATGDQKRSAFIRGRMETLWPRIKNRKGLTAPGGTPVPALRDTERGLRPLRLPVKPQLTAQQRAQRPLIDEQAWRLSQMQRQDQLERREHWHDPYMDGVERYQWETIADLTFTAGDTPPGFEDWHEFFQYVQGQDQDVINHLVHAFAQGETGNHRRIKAGEQGLDLSYDRSKGLPPWSPYR